MKNAVAYVRVSSSDQEREGFSIPAQRKLLREYAARKGFTVLHEYEDVETAKRAGRQSFDAMVGFLKKNPSTCRVVLVEKTDRLYRNIKDWVTLDDLDLEVHFAKDNFILSEHSRSNEKFIHGIKVLMAKQYVENLSEEVLKGFKEKIEQGIYPSGAPMGYDNVGSESGKRIVVPNPDVAPIIIRAFERFATGNYSLREIADLAAEDGLCTPRNRTKVYKSAIQRILSNRFYMGEFKWKGTVYPGIHEPLVTLELWEQVQAVLDGRRPPQRRPRRNDLPFAGLIRCGHCDRQFVGETKKGRYTYYHCTGTCKQPYVRQEVLEGQFTALLDRLHFDDEILEWMTTALRQSHADERNYREQAIRELEAKSKRLQTRIERAYDDRLDGRITTEFFERRSAEWRAEQARAQAAIDRHLAANETYYEDGVRLIELAQRARIAFEKQPTHEKRRMLNLLVSNCYFEDGAIRAEFRHPFDILADSNDEYTKRKAAGADSDGLRSIWRGVMDTFRTLCVAPDPAARALFEGLRRVA